MGELIPRISEIAQTKRDIKKALLKLDGLAEFNGQAMSYVNLLDMRRQLLTAHNPAIGQLLEQLEFSFAADALRIQNTMYRGF